MWLSFLYILSHYEQVRDSPSHKNGYLIKKNYLERQVSSHSLYLEQCVNVCPSRKTPLPLRGAPRGGPVVPGPHSPATHLLS